MRDGADRPRQRLPAFERGGDVEHHHFVDPFDVVAAGELRRVAGVPQLLELDALDHLPVAHVHARDDAFGQHLARQIRQESCGGSAGPASPDFSGWNCTPNTWSRSTAAANDSACVVDATQSAVTGAAKECVKYTCAPDRRPDEQPRRQRLELERVPPDVRNLQPLRRVALQQPARPLEHAQAGNIGRLLAAFVQPLHADADAEQGSACIHGAADRLAPRCIERRRGGEVTDAGDDQRRRRPRTASGVSGTVNSAPSAASAFLTDVRLPAP